MSRLTAGLAAGVLVLGVGLAVGLAYSLGWVAGPQAVVVYHVADGHPCCLGPGRGFSVPEYKRGQLALVTDPRTLEAALADPAVRGLPTVPADGAVEWLGARLRVDPRGNTEFFTVVIRGTDPDESLALLGAVDRAYRAASHDRENAGRRSRRAVVEREHAAAEEELKALRDRLELFDWAHRRSEFSPELMERFREQQARAWFDRLAALRRQLVAADPAERDQLGAEALKVEGKLTELGRELEARRRFPAELEALRKEVAAREAAVARLAADLETLRIEGDAPSRVAVFEEPRVVRRGH